MFLGGLRCGWRSPSDRFFCFWELLHLKFLELNPKRRGRVRTMRKHISLNSLKSQHLKNQLNLTLCATVRPARPSCRKELQNRLLLPPEKQPFLRVHQVSNRFLFFHFLRCQDRKSTRLN